jgi:hypothetical protein
LASTRAIGRVEDQISGQVIVSPAPAGSIDASTLGADLKAAATAFATFASTYRTDVKTILLPTGTTNPSANRAVFDSAVATALGTLNSSVAAAVANLPAAVTTTLVPTLKNDLLTASPSTGKSLQERLAAIATPASTGPVSSFLFSFRSSSAIARAGEMVASDILAAVKAFNQTF